METSSSSPKRSSGGIVKTAKASTPTIASSTSSKRKLDLIEPTESSSPKGKKERVLSSATRILILPDKVEEEEMDSLRDLVTELGGMNSSLAYANVVLTALRSEKRVARQLSKDVLDRKVAVLHLSWLYDSAQERLLQPFDQYRVVQTSPLGEGRKKASPQVVEAAGSADSQTEEEQEEESEHVDDIGRFGSREGSVQAGEETTTAENPDLAEEDVDQRAHHDQGPKWQNVEYACLRPSPLKSRLNQELVDELEILRLQRTLAGKQEMNATAYGRAISAVKALPFRLSTQPGKARNVKGIGPKIAKLIEQYYRQGYIAESQSIRKDKSFEIMTQFMELYGVGPKRAREYYSQGARTLDDVIKMGGSLGTHLHIQDCLRILPDLRCKIPRAEVLEIAQLIQSELDTIRPGCLHTVCGGFRRGKLESNDVDIVITDPNPTNINSQITCMEELLRQLKKKALVTHVVNVTTPSSTFEAVFSHLDIAEIVLLPPVSTVVTQARHRRVDIIFCPYETYGAAVLGWTGSRQFERDLRLLAKHRGFKFHSTGLVSQNDSRPHKTAREEDIFDLLQIPYMPPHLRNCDA